MFAFRTSDAQFEVLRFEIMKTDRMGPECSVYGGSFPGPVLPRKIRLWAPSAPSMGVFFPGTALPRKIRLCARSPPSKGVPLPEPVLSPNSAVFRLEGNTIYIRTFYLCWLLYDYNMLIIIYI